MATSEQLAVVAGIDTAPEAALCVVVFIYGLAALFNTRIPDTGCVYAHQAHTPMKLLRDFANCYRILWRDKLGQISLAATTLIWGVAGNLRFIGVMAV